MTAKLRKISKAWDHSDLNHKALEAVKDVLYKQTLAAPSPRWILLEMIRFCAHLIQDRDEVSHFGKEPEVWGNYCHDEIQPHRRRK